MMRRRMTTYLMMQEWLWHRWSEYWDVIKTQVARNIQSVRIINIIFTATRIGTSMIIQMQPNYVWEARALKEDFCWFLSYPHAKLRHCTEALMRLHVKNRHCLLQLGFGMVNCNEEDEHNVQLWSRSLSSSSPPTSPSTSTLPSTSPSTSSLFTAALMVSCNGGGPIWVQRKQCKRLRTALDTAGSPQWWWSSLSSRLW